MSNTRNPKDIRGMVSGSERDVDDMKSNLDKLKNLSEDDKKENAMLRSRIDEQCQLIMILKQRADDVQGKTSTLERINKELMDFRSNSQEMLNAELRKNSLLEKRFDELASNHQEMIKIKDEYKRSNQDLRQENSRLRDENARLFSGAIVEKDQQIADLEKKLASLKEQSGSQELKQRQSLQDLRAREQELQREIAGLQEQYRTDLKTLQSKLQDTEERLKDTVGNSTESTTVDGINLDEIKEFAKQFKIRRLSLGLTQTQVGQALSATEGPAYSQSAICRFEKLDITPKSAQKIKPVLERWMQEAEERYKNGIQNLTDFIGSEPSKKRKRRTSFTPQALEVLNNFFERNTHPSGAEMTELSDKLNYDREVIRVWFCNKRQALKNTIKKLKQETP